jgi:hypothetical protein
MHHQVRSKNIVAREREVKKGRGHRNVVSLPRDPVFFPKILLSFCDLLQFARLWLDGREQVLFFLLLDATFTRRYPSLEAPCEVCPA